MKVYSLLAAALIVQGCGTLMAESDPVIAAQPYIGLEERVNRAELRELVGVDPVHTEWCAAFVNAILELEGIPTLNDQDRYPPLMARSFLHWGERINPQDIQRGDVVIFPRGREGWKGHVGFYVETQLIDGEEQWVILGGNQDQSVKYSLYNPNRALGIRRWQPIEDQ